MPIIARRDVLAQAQSGTGKTGTFSIGILERIDVSQPHCQVCFLFFSPSQQTIHYFFDVFRH